MYHRKRFELLTVAVLSLFVLPVGLARGQYYEDYNDEDDLTPKIPEYAGELGRARTALHTARDKRDHAQRALRRVRMNILEQMRNSPEYTRAKLKVADLRREYRDARDEAVEQLSKNKPEYLEAVNRAEEIDQKIKKLHRQDNVPQGRIEELAEKHLEARDRADSMLLEALETKQIDDLERRLIDAENKLDRIAAKYRQRINTNPRVVDARQRVRDARDDMRDARMAIGEYLYKYGSAIQQEESVEEEPNVIIDDDDHDHDVVD